MSPARAVRRLAATIVLLGLAGCAAGPSSAPTDTAAAEAPFESLERLPAEGAVDAADLLPGHDGSERWRSLSGVESGRTFDVVTEPDGPGRRTRTSDLETAHWARAADGSIDVPRVDSHPDGAASLFDPPLRFSPARLAAGEEFAVSAAMRVVRLSNPASERDRGTATRSVRYARDERIRLHGEAVRAQVVESTFVAELGSARAERTAERWVLPGRGVVAERWHETLVILKVFTKRSEQLSVREPDPADSRPEPQASR